MESPETQQCSAGLGQNSCQLGCQGRTTVTQDDSISQFSVLLETAKSPLRVLECRKCLNAGISYLRNLVGTANNMTFSTCRDATFATLASQVDNASADVPRCFFGVKAHYTSRTISITTFLGFCIERHERFLMYEYMPNGSLKDQLHSRSPISWRTRIQIAIDLANALEYLHFYCDPPLCHRDIKSSNILLDENFVRKVKYINSKVNLVSFYYGRILNLSLVLAYQIGCRFWPCMLQKDGSICFEPVNTDIKGTPGYMDPEYVITQELTEKSDVYSYGVVLLELVTGRRAIEDNKNLIEWAEIFMTSESRITELVDPNIGDSYDFDQLQTLLAIVRWCTQKEGRARPSIRKAESSGFCLSVQTPCTVALLNHWRMKTMMRLKVGEEQAGLGCTKVRENISREW
ncbi:hypothetical protein HAX54_002216 [Datura stramonium]|uniref:Protein kinase domain-containing protein n=1 Tax=Datura stramonium TaxID=4076 RepID=A0ABS8RT65_DATST|nr:hypothetical protein [Datura stramonium]